MWKRLFMVLLLVSLCVPCLLFSLTEEEEKYLPTLSKTELIQIIMHYEMQTLETEKSLIERENKLKQKEISLNQKGMFLTVRDTALIENEAHLKLRESLLAESLLIHEQRENQIRTNSLVYGGIGGLILGMVVSSIIEVNIGAK